MDKEELFLNDFEESIANVELDEKYLRLYTQQDDRFKKIFTYFHQTFNSLFEFMNVKRSSNGHFNAQPSRELMDLIATFNELRYVLKSNGKEVSLMDYYEEVIERCSNFLEYTNGSAIPEDFERINVIKHETILELPNNVVHIKQQNESYQLSDLGQGAFSLVQKYKDEHYDKIFALKMAKKDLDERELKRFKREFEILKSLNFPYILEVYTYNHGNNSYVMELCDSTLYDYIRKNNQRLPFETRKKLALQFLYGINYLHQKKILHRDISYRNILVKIYDFNAVFIKLSDFGLIKEESSDFTNSDSDIKGTIVDPSLESFKDYNDKNEIYAVGFIILYIFTGKSNLSDKQGDVYDIVNKCTDRDMKKRYSAVSAIIGDVDSLEHT